MDFLRSPRNFSRPLGSFAGVLDDVEIVRCRRSLKFVDCSIHICEFFPLRNRGDAGSSSWVDFCARPRYLDSATLPWKLGFPGFAVSFDSPNSGNADSSILGFRRSPLGSSYFLRIFLEFSVFSVSS